MKKLMKKAQMEHFNWIFVLVAGTIILIFFVTIVQKQRLISETKLAASIRTDIGAILTGAASTPDTINLLTMPRLDIYFTCDEEGYSDFHIEETGVNKETSFDVIFAPDLVKGPSLITWSKELKTPFKVMPFLYLTDAQVRYVLISSPNNQLAQKIEAELPDEMNKEARTSAAGIINKNNYKVKFIFFGEIDRNAAYSFRTMPDKDVTAIKISQNNIEFYKKQGSVFVLEGTAFFPNDEEDAFIYGAIFSEDKTFFECNLKKALKRLAVVSELFAVREQKVKEAAGSSCAPYYYGKIEELASVMRTCSASISACDFANLDIITSSIKQNHDQALAYHTECPQIY